MFRPKPENNGTGTIPNLLDFLECTPRIRYCLVALKMGVVMYTPHKKRSLHPRVIVQTSILLGFIALSVQAADWPMWRCNAKRNGVTEQQLSSSLHLQWTKQYPPQPRAFPAQDRLDYDETLQPIVAEGMLIVASAANDRVDGLDVETGEERWRFYAEGPVRFAPAYYNGHVYFASDDGYVYCLDRDEGTLNWKMNAAVGNRRILGNERFISVRPCRAGPVIHDGVLYVAAGIWPFEGTYVYALSPEDGSRIWINDGSGATWMNQPHGGATSFAGPAPQGYIAADQDFLIIPNGRAVAACFDAEDGRMRYFHHAANKKNGGWRASIDAGRFHNAGKTFNLSDGKNADIKIADPLWGRNEAITIGGKTASVSGESFSFDGLTFSPGGTMASLVAGADRLFAVSREGSIYCYGEQSATPVSHELPSPTQAPTSDEFTVEAQRILELTDTYEGYCVALSVGNGRLIEEIVRNSELRVVALENNQNALDSARRRFDDMGWYGSRISIIRGDLSSIALAPYCASLVISETPIGSESTSGSDFAQRLYDILRPYGATACLKGVGVTQIESWIDTENHPNAVIEEQNGFCTIKRSGALPGSDDWSHQYANSANTVVSRDDRVKAPLGLLWFGGSTNTEILPRHGHGPSPQVAGGRLFSQGLNLIRAKDVYTGRILWERNFENVGKSWENTSHQPGANALGSNYVSLEDAVYVIHRNICNKLDPSTGEIVATFALPDNASWGYIGVSGDYLVAGGGVQRFGSTSPGRFTLNGTSSKRLIVLDRFTGELVWTHEMANGFRHNAIALSSDRVFVIDYLWKDPDGLFKKRATAVGPGALFAFDLASGDTVWQVTEGTRGTFLSYSSEHDLVIEGGSNARDRLSEEVDDCMNAYRADNGTSVWTNNDKYEGPFMIHGDMIITQGKARSISDGTDQTVKSPITLKQQDWEFTRKYGCNTAIGSEHMITFRSGAAGYFDLSRYGGTGNFGGFKSSCTSNLIAANGVLNAPDYTRTCVCSYQNQTSLALVPLAHAETWTYNDFNFDTDERIARIGINFGAPGDRRADNGVLWVEYPSVGGESPEVDVSVEYHNSIPEDTRLFRHHANRVTGGKGYAWVCASGIRDVRRVTVKLNNPDPSEYNVRLYFIEPETVEAGQRDFTVYVNGSATERIDILDQTGEPMVALTKEYRAISAGIDFDIEIESHQGTPILSGLEIVDTSLPLDSIPDIPVSAVEQAANDGGTAENTSAFRKAIQAGIKSGTRKR